MLYKNNLGTRCALINMNSTNDMESLFELTQKLSRKEFVYFFIDDINEMHDFIDIMILQIQGIELY